jgi:hypothetical protein
MNLNTVPLSRAMDNRQKALRDLQWFSHHLLQRYSRLAPLKWRLLDLATTFIQHSAATTAARR